MTNKEIKILREKIAGLSSGVYYDSIFQFFATLDGVLLANNCVMDPEYPQVYNDEGRNILKFNVGDQEFQVFWTYYRMQSGRWEIICYMT